MCLNLMGPKSIFKIQLNYSVWVVQCGPSVSFKFIYFMFRKGNASSLGNRLFSLSFFFFVIAVRTSGSDEACILW